MFKKLVASITLSPSAMRDLSAYSKRLKVQTPYRVATFFIFVAALILELIIVNMPAPPLPTSRTPTNVAVTKNADGLRYNISANNLSQGNSDATTTPAQAGDQILYTLTAENHSKEEKSTTFAIDLQDAFDYASLLGNNDGSLTGTILEWPETTIQPNEDQARTFTIKMDRDISTAPSSGIAYDCLMSTGFGILHESVVRCSTVKTISSEVDRLPKIGVTTSIVITSVAAFTSLILLLRNLQLRREAKVMRDQLTEGII